MENRITKIIYWLKNRKNYKNPKKINLSNILNYAEAEVRHWKSTSDFLKNPEHIDEQSIWRLSQIKKKSPKCIQELRCVNCGCDINEKSFESKGCDEDCYSPMMNKAEWTAFKRENNITEIN